METEFLDKATDSLYERLDAAGGDPLQLPAAQQPVVLLMTMQAMIDNGGIRYPMENDFPFTPPYSVFSDAYRTIGATDAADAFDKAIAMFPFSEPEKHAELRDQFMGSFDDDAAFFALGDLICGDKRVWQLLDAYVKNNAAALGL